MSGEFGAAIQIVLDALPAPVYLKDRAGTFIYANKAFLNLLESPCSEVIGRRAEDFASPRVATKSNHSDALLNEENPENEVVTTHTRKDGVEFIIQAKKRLIEIPGVGPCILCILNDISQFVLYEKELEEKHRELRRQQGKLKELATIDPLTGIFNRRAFYDKAEEIIKYAEVGNLDVGVLMFDLDNFKILNDTHGHAVGDEVLMRFTKVVSDCIRGSDIFARLGGEEFVLLLPDTPKEATYNIAERIRQRVENTPVHVNGASVSYTTSVGGTMWMSHEHRIDNTLNRADKYLYQAKEAGRNAVRFVMPNDEADKSAAVA